MGTLPLCSAARSAARTTRSRSREPKQASHEAPADRFAKCRRGERTFRVRKTRSDRFGAASVISAGDPLPGANLARLAVRRIPISFLIGSGDFGIANTRSSRAALMALGFEVRYTELPGVGHCCPLRGRAADEWSWLSSRPLP